MSSDIMLDMKMIETALKHVGEEAMKADHLAKLINGLLEGDDPDEAQQALIDYGYCDKDGFWIGEE